MKRTPLLTRYRPSEGFWLVLSLLALVLVVALPAAAWTHLEALAFGRP